MHPSRNAWSARALTLVLIALAAALTSVALMPQTALAGTYTVTACEAAPDGHSNNSWWQGSSGWGYYTVTGCPNDAGGNRQGMLAMSGLGGDVGTMGLWTAGWTRFDAPAGTTITSVALNYDGR